MRMQLVLTSLERMEPKRMRTQNTGGIDEPGEDGAEEHEITEYRRY
jgi:hypothetical protein